MPSCVAFAVLLIACCTDLRSRIIPNRLVLLGALAIVTAHVGESASAGGFAAVMTTLSEALLGGAVCFAAMFILWLAGGTGGGDVKLAFVIGAFLGWRDGMSATVWCHVIAAVFLLALLAWRRLALALTPDVSADGSAIVAATTSALTDEAEPMTVPMAPFFTIGCVVTLLGGSLL